MRDGVRVLSASTEDDGGLRAWDHGCQFFRADSAEFKSALLPGWLEGGFAKEWQGRFGVVCGQSSAPAKAPDFFGLPTQTPVFHGVGGMHAIAEGVLSDAIRRRPDVTVHIRNGVRVAKIEHAAGKWELYGTSGEAALHDSKEEVAAKAKFVPCSPHHFDALLVTDVSASFDGWHRASAGLPSCADALSSRVRARVRVPLFTALVSFANAIPKIDLDGITFDDDVIWFAARSASKDGLTGPANDPHQDHTWTLVSTPAYAVAEIERVPMQDPVTGAFIPQSDEYLQSEDGPARTLLRAFAAALAPAMAGVDALPEVTYITAQRWGSAMPAPVHVDGRDGYGAGPMTSTVLNVRYDGSKQLPLVPSCDDTTVTTASHSQPATAAEADFLFDDALKLYYAGDFCSWRVPGVEAAALSGLHVAKHMATALCRE